LAVPISSSARSIRPSKGKRILVIGHDAYRAGAQISLLHILRWLKSNYPADFTLLLKGGGELLDEYASLLPTQVFAPSQGPGPGPRPRVPLAQRLARRFVHPALKLLHPVGLSNIDLIYFNSVASLDLSADLASARQCPVLCHVHELDMSIRRFLGLQEFKRAQAHIDAYIAVSRAVANNLIVNHGVDPQSIHQIYEAILLPDLTHVGRSSAREDLRIPPGAFVVGGCGTMDWRKSPNLFLQIAHRLVRSAPRRPVHFVWVGGQTSGWELDVLRYDVERMRLRDLVHFVGPQREPTKYFSLFDVFLLTSREDPFPLVCLEAAALEVPTVCFADAGGMPEFVGDDAGFVVPYLDLEGAANCILSLATSEELRSELGRRAAEKVKRHDIEVVGHQIARVLDKYLR
jgi:glycosyltransferase involved in cell wall biosynthesis